MKKPRKPRRWKLWLLTTERGALISGHREQRRAPAWGAQQIIPVMAIEILPKPKKRAKARK